MSAASEPAWVATPPSRFDIVATYFPERTAIEKPGLKLRPGLVVSVHRGKTSGLYACRIAYGTKNLKIVDRQHLDLIVQTASDLPLLGLHRATRFDLDLIIMLPWNKQFFGCWSGHRSPVIGALTEDYVKVFAYHMMRRGSVTSSR